MYSEAVRLMGVVEELSNSPQITNPFNAEALKHAQNMLATALDTEDFEQVDATVENVITLIQNILSDEHTPEDTVKPHSHPDITLGMLFKSKGEPYHTAYITYLDVHARAIYLKLNLSTETAAHYHLRSFTLLPSEILEGKVAVEGESMYAFELSHAVNQAIKNEQGWE